nr:hypothetical protein [Salmonella enterica]
MTGLIRRTGIRPAARHGDGRTAFLRRVAFIHLHPQGQAGVMAGLQPLRHLQRIAVQARHLPGRIPQLQAGAAVEAHHKIPTAGHIRHAVQLHRAFTGCSGFMCHFLPDKGQYVNLRCALFCPEVRLFVGQQGDGNLPACVRQFDSQLQVRRPQGAQPACRFHATAGGAQVVTVHRTVAPALQQFFQITGADTVCATLLQPGQYDENILCSGEGPRVFSALFISSSILHIQYDYFCKYNKSYYE